ncbi:MAG: hypothetical protein ACUVX8_00825 [Candidatus Zipacnadales bacterium]
MNRLPPPCPTLSLIALLGLIIAISGCASSLQDFLIKDKETGTWHIDEELDFGNVVCTNAELKLQRYGILGSSLHDTVANISGTIEFTALATNDPSRTIMYQGVYHRDGGRISALEMLKDGESTASTLSLQLVIKTDTRMEGFYEHTNAKVTTGSFVARR